MDSYAIHQLKPVSTETTNLNNGCNGIETYSPGHYCFNDKLVATSCSKNEEFEKLLENKDNDKCVTLKNSSAFKSWAIVFKFRRNNLGNK